MKKGNIKNLKKRITIKIKIKIKIMQTGQIIVNAQYSDNIYINNKNIM